MSSIAPPSHTRTNLGALVIPYGKAWQGEARQGMAWHGKARHGEAGHGLAGRGKARKLIGRNDGKQID